MGSHCSSYVARTSSSLARHWPKFSRPASGAAERCLNTWTCKNWKKMSPSKQPCIATMKNGLIDGQVHFCDQRQRHPRNSYALQRMFVRRTALRCYKRWDVTMGSSLFTLAPYAFVFQRGRRRPARIPLSQRRTLLPVGGRIYDLLTLSNYRP